MQLRFCLELFQRLEVSLSFQDTACKRGSIARLVGAAITKVALELEVSYKKALRRQPKERKETRPIVICRPAPVDILNKQESPNAR